jgi:DNA-binding NarL/FixJ family response regulator
MNVLVVEDDEIKRLQLEEFIKATLQTTLLGTAKSLHSALTAIATNNYDLILLDMTMPTFDICHEEDGGRPQHYAGREILRQLDRRGIRTQVIVVTQFDVFGEGVHALTRGQLHALLEREHPRTYCGMVYYDSTTDEWKHNLQESIASLPKRG